MSAISNVIIPRTSEAQVESANQEKSLALILVSELDEDFVQHPAQHPDQIIIQEIAKTHRIVIRTLQDPSLWGQVIRDVTQEQNEPIKRFCVLTHGMDSKMFFGTLQSKRAFSSGDLHPEDFEPLAQDATILLRSCRSGRELAPRMAAVSKRVVMASKEDTPLLRTGFAMVGNEPRFISYNEEGAPIMHAFFPNGSEELVTVPDETKRELFSNKIEYLKSIALTHDREAQYHLGELFLMLPKDIRDERSQENSLHWLRLAAEQGEVRALYELAATHIKGIPGISKSDSEAEAVRYLRLAVEKGYKNAQFSLGFAYFTGKFNLPKSDEEALKLFLLAAAQELPAALYHVGICFEEGRGGVAASAEAALPFYAEAAQKGETWAQCSLARFYMRGLGGLEQSNEEAIRWFRNAADQGLPQAQCILGDCYSQGILGLPKLPQEALSWYYKAAIRGFSRGVEGYNRLSKEMAS